MVRIRIRIEKEIRSIEPIDVRAMVVVYVGLGSESSDPRDEAGKGIPNESKALHGDDDAIDGFNGDPVGPISRGASGLQVNLNNSFSCPSGCFLGFDASLYVVRSSLIVDESLKK
ncbi:hypothetical protein Pdw03_1268 [Penicillium digitatum]|uniref:Uncharacterized protein n=1 Tax=Penicillium digitatum TaxID=36651 RepID=A0A7T7BNJ9_PENDI|nr:hypothetical protein Pdw03_1268 [Penicillium digitatum]